jgi:hypothetical protein
MEFLSFLMRCLFLAMLETAIYGGERICDVLKVVAV